ncbi:MAG: CAP domain-containing protein [Candidatus Thiodiazotropha sp.]
MKPADHRRTITIPARGIGLVTCLAVGASLACPTTLLAAVWAPQELAVVQMVNLQREFHNLDPVQTDDRLRNAALSHSQAMADYDFFSHTTLAGPNPTSPGERIDAAGYDWTRFGENIAAGQGRAAPTYTTPSAAVDAAHDVMYGTEDFNEINDFFSQTFSVTASGWDTLGEGLSGDQWDAWYSEQEGSGGWMGSAGHRNTILNGLLDDIGVGYVWDSTDNSETDILADTRVYENYPLYTYWTQEFASGDSLEPSPVPLPGAVWLLGSGLLGLIAVAKRKPLGETEAV